MVLWASSCIVLLGGKTSNMHGTLDAESTVHALRGLYKMVLNAPLLFTTSLSPTGSSPAGRAYRAGEDLST